MLTGLPSPTSPETPRLESTISLLSTQAKKATCPNHEPITSSHSLIRKQGTQRKAKPQKRQSKLQSPKKLEIPLKPKKKTIQKIETDRSHMRKVGWAYDTARSNNQEKRTDKKSRIKQLQQAIIDYQQQIKFLKSLYVGNKAQNQNILNLKNQITELKNALQQSQGHSKFVQNQLKKSRLEFNELKEKSQKQAEQSKKYLKKVNSELQQLRAYVAQLQAKKSSVSYQPVTKNQIDDKPERQLNDSQKQEIIKISELVRYRIQALFLSTSQFQFIFRRGKTYTQSELSEMLRMQPFMLTSRQQQLILQVLKGGRGEDILKRCEKWLGQIMPLDQDQQQEMINALSQFVTQFQNELKSAIGKYANSSKLIKKGQLIKLLQKIGLESDYVELVIRRLSLYSQDLENLSIAGFWETFFRPKDFSQIEEEGSQLEQEQVY